MTSRRRAGDTGLLQRRGVRGPQAQETAGGCAGAGPFREFRDVRVGSLQPPTPACGPGTCHFQRAQNRQDPSFRFNTPGPQGRRHWGVWCEPFQPRVGPTPALNAGRHNTIHITEIYGRCLPLALSFWTKSISNNQSLDT